MPISSFTIELRATRLLLTVSFRVSSVQAMKRTDANTRIVDTALSHLMVLSMVIWTYQTAVGERRYVWCYAEIFQHIGIPCKYLNAGLKGKMC